MSCCKEMEEALKRSPSVIYKCDQGWFLDSHDDMDFDIPIKWCPFCNSRLGTLPRRMPCFACLYCGEKVPAPLGHFCSSDHAEFYFVNGRKS